MFQPSRRTQVQAIIDHTYAVRVRGETPVQALDRWVTAVPVEFRADRGLLVEARRMLAKVSRP